MIAAVDYFGTKWLDFDYNFSHFEWLWLTDWPNIEFIVNVTKTDYKWFTVIAIDWKVIYHSENKLFDWIINIFECCEIFFSEAVKLDTFNPVVARVIKRACVPTDVLWLKVSKGYLIYFTSFHLRVTTNDVQILLQTEWSKTYQVSIGEFESQIIRWNTHSFHYSGGNCIECVVFHRIFVCIVAIQINWWFNRIFYFPSANFKIKSLRLAFLCKFQTIVFVPHGFELKRFFHNRIQT